MISAPHLEKSHFLFQKLGFGLTLTPRWRTTTFDFSENFEKKLEVEKANFPNKIRKFENFVRKIKNFRPPSWHQGGPEGNFLPCFMGGSIFSLKKCANKVTKVSKKINKSVQTN